MRKHGFKEVYKDGCARHVKLRFQRPLLWPGRLGMGPKSLHFCGSSLAGQWLRLGAFAAGAQV